ncbi:hypothetical protein [Neobacillus kokaensis]|uniref:Uncharacterized protein n=1 Tax=Neobacillus kokaensis TaxID=2759023 RepID=A0ABQ3MVU3_9BACI|nr:hypothetical protein [Neobacillus kokaensis]GHH96794.1 hypothetical protein AM1BK_03370 [Neobacillus kokaensis]
MTRAELYNQKPKQSPWRGLLLFIITCMIVSAGVFGFLQYYQNTIKIEAPTEKLGKKVVIDLPNGQKVYTYDHLIIEKNGKMYYKGERNTIDLTGGTVVYENWKEPE